MDESRIPISLRILCFVLRCFSERCRTLCFPRTNRQAIHHPSLLSYDLYFELWEALKSGIYTRSRPHGKAGWAERVTFTVARPSMSFL